ncbi:biopolymer transporter ExbD [Pendulispora brunnea]|uniref:Biopolymer transporter ExbD n=1 Tax=Pendulispora brunnea TaxID=2905690 RepID=A0ABZ2KMP8_9BACT
MSKYMPQPEINVTPLVDVVLVLLIIFMVIAPALEHGERVELPAIVRPDPKSKLKQEPITVSIAASGKIFLEKDMVDRDTLGAKLDELHEKDAERRVVLKGDSSLNYGEARAVFAMVEKTGFGGCSLMVSKKGKEDEPEEAELAAAESGR